MLSNYDKSNLRINSLKVRERKLFAMSRIEFNIPKLKHLYACIEKRSKNKSDFMIFMISSSNFIVLTLSKFES